MAARIDFELRSNAAFSWPCKLVDENDQPHDYTGVTFKLQAKAAGGGAAVIDIESGDGIVHDNEAAAEFTFDFPGGVAVGTYNYDCLRTLAGKTECEFFGTIIISQGVTTP